MALKIVADDPKSFKVRRADGEVIHIAKTAETMPLYKLCKGGMVGDGKETKDDADTTPNKPAPIAGGYAEGGKVEGKARVAGDSKKNDTVDAKLSPGEIVIPRSIASDPKKAMAFIQEALAGKHPAKGTSHDVGGEIPAPGIDTQQALAANYTPQQPPEVIAPNVSANNASPEDLNALAAKLNAGPAVSPPAGLAAPTPAPEAGLNPPVTPNVPKAVAGPSALPSVTQTGTTMTSEAPTAAQTGEMDKLGRQIEDYKTTAMDAANAEAGIHVAKATAEKNLIDENNLKYQTFVADRDKEVASRLADIKAVEGKFAGMSIDGGRFFGDGVTSSKVMAGIGLALGALGQGFTGKDYGVQGIIERAIDRDIEVQKANANKVGKEVELARGGLRDYLSVSHDMDTAIASEKARQLEAVGKQFEAISAGNSSAAIKAAAQQQAIGFQEKVAGLRNQIGKNVTTQTIQTMPMKMDPVPEKVNEEVNKNVAASAALQRIRELQSTAGSGPIEGRIANLKAKFGMQGADDAEFQQKLRENFINLVHDVGGSRGFSSQERGFFENATLSNLLNDKSFDRILTDREKEVNGNLNMLKQAGAENRQYPIDIEGRKAAYRGSAPANYSDQFFKAQGFNKKSGK